MNECWMDVGKNLRTAKKDLMSFYVCSYNGSIRFFPMHCRHHRTRQNEPVEFRVFSTFNLATISTAFQTSRASKIALDAKCYYILNKEIQCKKESQNFNSFPCMKFSVMQLSSAWRDLEGWRGRSTMLQKSVGSDSSARSSFWLQSCSTTCGPRHNNTYCSWSALNDLWNWNCISPKR